MCKWAPWLFARKSIKQYNLWNCLSIMNTDTEVGPLQIFGTNTDTHKIKVNISSSQS